MTKNKIKTILLPAFIALLLMSFCGCEKGYGSGYDGMLGSAGEITDDTVIVSIFADDRNYKWTDSAKDTETKQDCLKRLSEATNYLEREVKNYVGDDEEGPTFYYDWNEDEELYFTTSFDKDLPLDLPFGTIAEYVKENIDSEALKKKYEADNILYMVFVNTDGRNNVPSYTLSWDNVNIWSKEPEPYMPEMTLIFYIDTYDDGTEYITYPQSYAHEIMHSFGAEDLYMTGNKINSSYVEYCQENNVDDIMNRINHEWFPFTEVDAYYLGLTDYADDVEKYGLGVSEHFPKEETE